MPAFYPEGDEPKLADPTGRSLHKINNLLKSIDAKTGSTTITGPVTVTNEVEIKNDANNPLPVSDNNGSLTVDGTVTVGNSVTIGSLPAISGTVTANAGGDFANAIENVNDVGNVGKKIAVQLYDDNGSAAGVPNNPLPISGTVTVNDMTSGNAKTKIVDSTGADVSYIPAGTAGTPSSSVLSIQGVSGGTQIGVSVTNQSLQVSGAFFQPVQPVSLASVPSHPVTGSGSFTAAQATASSLKAQAQILDSAGSLLTYGSTGVAGSPSSDVITVQGASAGTAVNTKILNSSGTAVTYAETGTYGSPSVDVLSVQNPQGVTATITTFTSTTASTSLVAAGSTRKALTVYNSGAGDLYISPTAVCTTTNFQLKLSSGDFWECPPSQVLLSHTAVFSTAGSTAYITSLT